MARCIRRTPQLHVLIICMQIHLYVNVDYFMEIFFFSFAGKVIKMLTCNHGGMEGLGTWSCIGSSDCCRKKSPLLRFCQDLLEHHFYWAPLFRTITVSCGVVLSAPEGQRESI